jgi:acetyl esterase/lipase
MKKTLSALFILSFLLTQPLSAQNWIDTLYAIETIEDIEYGAATDFAGNERTLRLDLSHPLNAAPECGRPLLVSIHGGAFIAGNEDGGLPAALRQDFAKRGYATASISYRLGQFPTALPIHCNVTALGAEWDCLNMTDSSEWYRAWFRAVQDARGAIRFLVNHAQEYQIDPRNIFLAGESAGGFIAMGAAYIDSDVEVREELTGALPDAPAPNGIYEAACVQGYQYDTSITSMNLSRPDLGSYEGQLNQPVLQPYTIKGVGNFYGGAFNNIFGKYAAAPLPALYLFHQPNDLIVPYDFNRVLAGYASCATQFPFNCQNMINRPFVAGSQGIVDWLQTMLANDEPTPDYLFETTANAADCAAQLFNPSVSGHAVDNYWLRTSHMAAFFASKIEDCAVLGVNETAPEQMRIYPNPMVPAGFLTVEGDFGLGARMLVSDVFGRIIYENHNLNGLQKIEINILQAGIYLVSIISGNKRISKKVTAW